MESYLDYTDEEKKELNIIVPYTRTIDYKTMRKLPYRNNTNIIRGLHLGQRKLLMTEIEFLTMAYEKFSEINLVIYIGSAPGEHIPLLSKMFPQYAFILYDPGKFTISETNRIKIYNKLFTSEEAIKIAKKIGPKSILFISDIRRDEKELEIMKDMESQMEWHLTMKPALSMLKFRLPYTPGTTNYLKGELYIQPWATTKSTEVRLITSSTSMKNYDNLVHEQVMYRFNLAARCQKYEGIELNVPGFDACYDCTTESYILQKYISTFGKKMKKLDRYSLCITQTLGKGLNFENHCYQIVDVYPYRRSYITKERLMEMFRNLQNMKFKVVKKKYEIRRTKIEPLYMGEYMLLMNEPDNFLKYNLITDYFTEPVRIKTIRTVDKISPYEFWLKNKANVRNIKDLEERREKLYELFYEPGNYRVSSMVFFCRFFKARRVLDSSSGWGDRLIGAIASNVERYVGVDPNTALFPYYKDILQTFGKFCRTKVTMINKPFEDVLLNEKFDLVLTSPPFFDTEIYTKEKTQSLSRYPRFEDWYRKFLLASMEKSIQALYKGGHLAINIRNSIGKPPYVERFIRDMGTRSDVKYLGVISEEIESKIASPMWIWEKI